MMCVVLRLLAFGAFHTVFADKTPQDVDNFNIQSLKSMNKFSEVMDGLQNPIWKATDAIKQEGIRSDDVVYTCEPDNDYKKFNVNYDAKMEKCIQCYDKIEKTKTTKDIKSAKKCCDKIIAALKKEANVLLDKVLKCIAKCAQLGADCRKMIKNKDADCNNTHGAISSKSD